MPAPRNETSSTTFFAASSSRCRCSSASDRAGATISRGSSYGEIESVKAVSDLVAPLSGEVLEVNAKVVDEPETVNEDPYGDGWLVKVRMSDPSEREALLDAAAYRSGLGG